MKMDVVAGSQNDEFYTPEYAIKPLLKYIPPRASIWCPFDTNESLFVKIFLACDKQVYYSHLSTGHDFFKADLSKVTVSYCISNPPYTRKADVLRALFNSKLNFAMLVGVAGLFESQDRFDIFRNNQFEMMYFNRRISYFKNYTDSRPALNPPFSSVYVCRGVLPKQIVFEEIQK